MVSFTIFQNFFNISIIFSVLINALDKLGYQLPSVLRVQVASHPLTPWLVLGHGLRGQEDQLDVLKASYLGVRSPLFHEDGNLFFFSLIVFVHFPESSLKNDGRHPHELVLFSSVFLLLSSTTASLTFYHKKWKLFGAVHTGADHKSRIPGFAFLCCTSPLKHQRTVGQKMVKKPSLICVENVPWFIIVQDLGKSILKAFISHFCYNGGPLTTYQKSTGLCCALTRSSHPQLHVKASRG